MTRHLISPKTILVLIGCLGLSLIVTACSGSTVSTATPAATAAIPAPTGQPTVANSTSLPTTAPVATPPGLTDIPQVSAFQSQAKPFNQLWKVELEAGYNPQVVGEADSLVFIINRQGGLYALDTKTGGQVWKQPTPPNTGPPPSQLTPMAFVAPGLVVSGDLAAEKLTAYDSKTGQKKWEHGLKFDAPNRDQGQRFLGGKVYDTVLVVAVSSKQDPLNSQTQTNNPEYLLVVGIELATGKAVWNAITDPPDMQAGIGIGNVIFASKMVLIESPDLSVGAIEAQTGNRRWRVLSLVLIRNDNPDILFSIVPEAGANHQPRLRRSDIETGRLLWEKVLPVQVVNDPPISVSPDEKTAYVSVIPNKSDSYVFAIDLDENKALWRYTTTTYGTYSLTALNNGVRLRNYGKSSGLVFFRKENPVPVTWIVGGLNFVDDIETREGIYLTARDEKNGGLLYLVGVEKGDIRLAARTEPPANEALLGKDQLYLPTLNGAGKPVIYAFARSQP